MKKKFLKKFKNNPGFTLMEMVITLAVFSTTILVVFDIYFTVTRTQRKVQTEQKLQSDARFALEAMAKEIRLGRIDYDYYKDPEGEPTYGYALDEFSNLAQPVPILAVVNADNLEIRYAKPKDEEVLKVYYCDVDACAAPQDVTPSGLQVLDLKFYISPASNPFSWLCSGDTDCNGGTCVVGACQCTDESQCHGRQSCLDGYCQPENIQSRVTINLVTQSTGVKPEEQRISYLQTTVVSRQYFR